ncbi:MAG: HvfC family RiPP maturation protein [Gammaproteobacteria bacterium]
MSDQDFQQIQRRFCEYMRHRHAQDEQALPALGLTVRQSSDSGAQQLKRLGIYHSMVYNNISGFLSQSFPTLKRRTGDELWQIIVRNYIQSKRSRTAIFPDIPGEFTLWFTEQGAAQSVAGTDTEMDPEQLVPLLTQLAHYTWVIHELDRADDEMPQTRPVQDWRQDRLVLSPLVWILQYDWPVHKIRSGPVAPKPTVLICWRNSSDKVYRDLADVLSAKIVGLLQESAHSGAQLLEQLQAEFSAEAIAARIDSMLLNAQILGAEPSSKSQDG